MSHSPGPWKIEEEGGDSHLCDAKGQSLMCNTQYYPWTPSSDDDWNLIAASPQLLRVVQLFLSAMARFGNWDEGCFYYNSVSASELQKPIEEAEAALVAAGVKFAG